MIDISYYLKLFKKPSLKSCLLSSLVAALQLSYTILGFAPFSLTNILSTIAYCAVLPFALELSSSVVGKDKFSRFYKNIVLLLSVLFSAFMTLGYSIEVVHNFSLCYSSPLVVSISLAKFVLLCYVCYSLINIVISWLNKPLQPEKENFNLKKAFLLLVGIRFILFLSCYPGFFDFDAAFGLRTILNEGEVLCNHHPLFVQFIHGTFFRLGKMMGNPSIGMGMLSILFIVLSSSIMVYGLSLLNKWGLTKKWLKGITVIYAALPLFPIVSLYITKDGFFAYAFLLYITTILELIISKGGALRQWRFISLHLLSVIFVCLTRHQGLYIVILETIILLCYYRRFWLYVLASTTPAIIIVCMFNNVLLPRMDVEPSNKKEMYGVLFQQTAYYLSQHPEDVTDSELDAIRAVMDPELIVDKYQFNIVDDVKSCYIFSEKGEDAPDGMLHFRHVDHSKEPEALGKYKKAWFSMFLKHPVTYVEATAAVIGAFFYNMGTNVYYLDTHWSESTLATNSDFTFFHFDTFVNFYNSYISRVLTLPFISLLFAMPYYIWLALILVALLLIRRDAKGMVLIFPILLSIGVLILCPVATGRYEWPIVLCIPLLVTYIRFNNNINTDNYELK